MLIRQMPIPGLREQASSRFARCRKDVSTRTLKEQDRSRQGLEHRVGTGARRGQVSHCIPNMRQAVFHRHALRHAHRAQVIDFTGRGTRA
jgi:hypothetical protein